jgi:autotransporter passenger strand-loop-strand repeat protein
VVNNGGNEAVFASGTASASTVNTGGTETVSSSGKAVGATLSGGSEVVAKGGTISATIVSNGGSDIVMSSGTASGTIIRGGGIEYVSAGGKTSATTVSAGGRQVVSSGGSASATVVSSGGSATIYSGATVTSMTLQAGGTIDLANMAFSSNASATVNGADLLTIISGTTTLYTQQLAGTYNGEYFNLATDGTRGTLVTEDTSPPCYCRGTRILTDRGEAMIEDLSIGDTVMTLSGEARPIRWIGYRHLDLRRHKTREQVQPILIRAGAFADGLPRRDLRVSPDHAMLLDTVLVPARLLINGASIERDTQCDDVTYHHIELETHDILLAEALPAESYLDTGNRGTFENADAPLILHPAFDDGQARRVASSCRPFVDDAASVKPFWNRLAARAVVLGLNLPMPIETTRDAGLHIVTSGRTIQPIGVIRGRYTFVLPETGDPIRLISRAARPCDARPWVEDRRHLGVMISRLTLRRDAAVETIPLDDPLLTSGWWDVESDRTTSWRWTNGDAAIPTCLNRPAVPGCPPRQQPPPGQQIPMVPGTPAERKIATKLQSPMILEVIVADSMDYPVESGLRTRHDRNLDPAATQAAVA